MVLAGLSCQDDMNCFVVNALISTDWKEGA